MTRSKQELQELARQMDQGMYVTKGTLYVAVCIALALGLYVGNLLTTIYAPQPRITTAPQAVAPTTQQSSPAAQQVDPGLAAAILTYEKMTRDNPSDVQAWTHLGHAYFDSNKPKAAIAAYVKSLALEPDNADVLTDLGVMYRRDKQPEMAVAQFDKALAVNPRHEQALFNKGIVLMHELNRKADALATWNALLAINPGATAPNGTPVSTLVRDHSN